MYEGGIGERLKVNESTISFPQIPMCPATRRNSTPKLALARLNRRCWIWKNEKGSRGREEMKIESSKAELRAWDNHKLIEIKGPNLTYR